MNRANARQLFPNSIIHPMNLNLVAYCKTVIEIAGCITVLVKRGQIECDLNIYITEVGRKHY